VGRVRHGLGPPSWHAAGLTARPPFGRPGRTSSAWESALQSAGSSGGLVAPSSLGEPGAARGVQIGKVRPGDDHAVHQLFHLVVAARLDLGDLPLIAVAGGALPQEQVQRLGIASAEDRR